MTGKLTHLLPCPFCGCTKVPKRQGNGIGDYWLECFECGASTRLREDGAGMEKDWNRRPAPTQQPSGEVMEKKILELADKYRIDYGGDYSRNAKEHELDLLAFVRAVLPSPTQQPCGEVTGWQPIASVVKSSAGTYLLINGQRIFSWLGTMYNDEADRIAQVINDAARTQGGES